MTLVFANGIESGPVDLGTVTPTATDNIVTITGFPALDAGVVAHKFYRQEAGSNDYNYVGFLTGAGNFVDRHIVVPNVDSSVMMFTEDSTGGGLVAGQYGYKVRFYYSFSDPNPLMRIQSSLSDEAPFTVTGSFNTIKGVIPTASDATAGNPNKRDVFRTKAAGGATVGFVTGIDGNGPSGEINFSAVTVANFTPPNDVQVASRVTARAPTGGSAPHGDSHVMLLDPSGGLIEGDDGGIYRLDRTKNGNGAWVSLIGDLGNSEVGAVAFDPINNRVLVGTQDTGGEEQTTSGATPGWTDLTGGDGNFQAVGIDGTKIYHYNLSTEFSSMQRQEFTAGGQAVGSPVYLGSTNRTAKATATVTAGALTIKVTDGGSGYTTPPAVTLAAPPGGVTPAVVGAVTLDNGRVTAVALTNPGSGYTTAPAVTIAAPPPVGLAGMTDIDRNGAGFQPYPFVVNAVDHKRLLLGWRQLYFSSDNGATVKSISTADELNSGYTTQYSNTDSGPSALSAIAYGGMNADGSPAPDVIYRARVTQIKVSEDNGAHWSAGFDLRSIGATGNVTQIALDPKNWKTAYATAGQKVFATTDGGLTWADITGPDTGTGALPSQDLTSVVLIPIDKPDMHFQLKDGEMFDVSLRGARTVGDIKKFIETAGTVVPTVTFSDPALAPNAGGVRATGTAVVDPATGKVTSVIITNPGKGYDSTAANTVMFSIAMGGLTTALGTVQIGTTGATAGQVTGVSFTGTGNTRGNYQRVAVGITSGSNITLTDKTTTGTSTFSVTVPTGVTSNALADLGLDGRTATAGVITGDALVGGFTATRMLSDLKGTATAPATGVRRSAPDSTDDEDVLLVGGSKGVYRVVNPVGDPAVSGAGYAAITAPSRAVFTVPITGPNNDLTFTAGQPGNAFNDTEVQFVNRPLDPPVQNTPAAADGGSLAANTTYYWVITATTAKGETTVSDETSLAIGATPQKAHLSWTRVPNATGYRIYRSTTSGTYSATSLVQPITDGATLSWDDTGLAATAGTPPTSNTAISAGPATATWNPFTETLVFDVRPTTTANDVVALLNGPDVTNMTATPNAGGGTLAEGTYDYKVSFLDANGDESNLSADNQAARATATVDNTGAVTINVANGGSGYDDAHPPMVTIAPPPGAGSPATAGTVTVVNGKVTAVAVNPGSSGYSAESPPKVTIGFATASRKVVPVDMDDSSVTLGMVPTGPAGTTARKIYRAVSGTNDFTLVGTINDNDPASSLTDYGTGPFDPAVSDPSRPDAPNVVAAQTTAKDGGSGGQLAGGTYKYRVTFVNGSGVESNPSDTFSVSGVNAGDLVTLTNLPTGLSGVAARRIYRTAAGGSLFGLIATVNDNATTTFTDPGVTAGALVGNTPPPPVAPAGPPAYDGSRALAPVGTATATPGGTDGTLTAGTYRYRFTFVDNAGAESNASAATTTTAPVALNQHIDLANIPLGPAGTVARRNIYRAGPAPGDNNFVLVKTLADNTTTTYTDGKGTAPTAPVVAPPNPAPATSAADSGTGGQLGAGIYQYEFSYVSKNGLESSLSPPVVTPSAVTANDKVKLTNIPVSTDATVAARRIYRTTAGGATFTLLATIYDNTTSTFTDTTGDAPATAGMTATPATGTTAPAIGQLAGGDYKYRVTFVSSTGIESLASADILATGVTAGNNVALDGIPLSPLANTVARRIYRTAANGETFTLLATINDNARTTFVDEVADGAQTEAPVVTQPSNTTTAVPSAGGELTPGTYLYRFTFVDNNGKESQPSAPVSVALSGTNDMVSLSSIPTTALGGGNQVARRIYRTAANGDTFRLLATLNDTTTTTFVDRDSGQGTDPITKAAGAAFRASLTGTDTTTAAAAGTGTVSSIIIQAPLAGGATTRVAAFADFAVQGGNNTLEITAVKPGKTYNDVAVRFLDAGTGVQESVQFDPTADPAGAFTGTLTFRIHPTTTAAQVPALLNNAAPANQFFTADLKTAVDTDKPLADLFAPDPTANGTDNTTKAEVTVAGVTFQEKTANLLKAAVTITVKPKAIQSKSIVITPGFNTKGDLNSLQITYIPITTPTVNTLLAALNALNVSTVANLSAVAGLFNFSATNTTPKLSSFGAKDLTGTIKTLGLSATSADGGNATYASVKLEVPGPNNDLLITAKTAGQLYNDVEISFVTSAAVTSPADVKVKWKPKGGGMPGGTLVFTINATTTKAIDIFNAMQPGGSADPNAKAAFQVELDPAELDPTTSNPNDGSGLIALSEEMTDNGKITGTAKATATVVVPNDSNDLQITAVSKSDRFNGMVLFTNTGRSTGSKVYVKWNAASRTLVFDINASTTAQNIVDAMALKVNKTAAGLFTVKTIAPAPGKTIVPGGVGLAAQGFTPAMGTAVPRWVEFGQNLPNAIVSAMSYTPAFKSPAGATVGDVLLVALRGRGVWKLNAASDNVSEETDLTITADANNDTFALRIDPNHPAPLDQWVDVYQLNLPEDRQLVAAYPLKELVNITVAGGDGNDQLLLDSRIRVAGAVHFDGSAGSGADSLVLLGAPGDALLSQTVGADASGSILIGGGNASTNPTLTVTYDDVQLVQISIPASAPDNQLARIQSGLQFLAASDTISKAVGSKALPLIGNGATQVLSGATGAVVPSDPDQPDLLTGQDAIDGGGSSEVQSILGRLLGEDTLAEISSGEIPDLETLRQTLDNLDSTAGNVTLTQATDGFAFDTTVDTTLDGMSALDLQAFGGTLFLNGSIDLSMEVKLHMIFGVDSQGFYILPTAPGDHLITVSHVQAASNDLTAGGDIGILSATISDATLNINPNVAITLDLTQPQGGEADGRIRLADFSAPLFDLFNVGIISNHSNDPTSNDVVFNANVTVSSIFGNLGTQNFVFTWADVTDPLNVTISGAGVQFVREKIHDLSVAINDGVANLQAQADALKQQLEADPAVTTTLPLVNQTLNSVLDGGANVSAVVQAASSVGSFLKKLDSTTDQLTLSGPDGYYVLTDGKDYAALPFNATTDQINSAIGNFASVGGAAHVTVTPGSTAETFTIGFQGLPAPTPTLSLAPAATATTSGYVLTVSATSGAYVLTDGVDYAALPHDATADKIQAALQKFSRIGPNVAVTAGATSGTFDIVSSNTNSLPSLQVATSSNASVSDNNTLTVAVSSGAYVLTDGTDYAALPYNATADQIKAALGSFASIGGAANVTVTAGSTAGTFTIALQGLPGATPALSAPTVITPSMTTQLIVSGTGGTAYVLTDGMKAPALPYDASAAAIQKVLGGFAGIGRDPKNVSVSATSTPGQFQISAAHGITLPTLTISGTGGSLSKSNGAYVLTLYQPATATATVNSMGVVTDIKITNGGSGYSSSSPPTVTIAAPSGSGSKAATLGAVTVSADGMVTAIAVKDGGSGYSSTSPPAVTIALPGSATTTIGDGMDSASFTSASTLSDIQTALGQFTSIAVDATVTGTAGHFTIAPRGTVTTLPRLQVAEDAGATFSGNTLTLPVAAFVVSDGTTSKVVQYTTDTSAEASAIQSALESFPSIGAGQDTVTYVPSGNY